MTGAFFEPVTGRYAHLSMGGKNHRIYVEEAGRGIPLLCLHTAGADSRQYRGVLNDPALLDRFRVVAFDLPWHGKSSPPAGFERMEYRLTTEGYIDTITAVIEALQLQRPIVMGCSIGGRVVLQLALRHPERFRAMIGLQSGLFAESPWAEPMETLSLLNRPEMHGGEVAGAMMQGIMGPESPREHYWETLWHYMQGGPGVLVGDGYYYLQEGDVRKELGARVDTAVCPLYLLSGNYDYSAPPSAALEVAKVFKGAKFQEMEGLGHFPMSEDPERFLSYLRPVLDEIASRYGE